MSRRRRPSVDRVTVAVVVLAVLLVSGTVPTATATVTSEPAAATLSSNPTETATSQPNSVPNATSTAASPDGPRLVAVHPNPLADGDAGEFVVVSAPRETTVTLSDGETTVDASVPTGRAALSSDPTATRALVDRPVIPVSGLELANGGERLVLSVGGRTVDTLVYENAPDGERLVRDDGERRWLPLGYEPRPVVPRGAADATAFVLPDSPDLAVETLRAADERILLAGYTLTSARVARALVAARERGVRVRVLVDDAPVGGLSNRAARTLDRLARAGVEVRVIGGEGARFSYYHPKYAVVDDRALVLTENWKPAGTGGQSSRGWGVRIDSPRVAGDLVALFANDATGRDVTPWTRFRRGRAFSEGDPPSEQTFPTRHDPERVRVESVRLLTAPGNAESAVVGVIDGAETSVDVVQVSVERDHPFVEATVDAARRGVRVRILLSGAWYVREENAATAEWLNRRAANEDLPLEARVADPGARYEKIHAKGVIADDTVLVGSLNWNRHSSRENREVVVALDGETVASYYREVFTADWRGGRGLGVGLGGGAGGLVPVAAVGCVAGAILAWRRLRFESGP